MSWGWVDLSILTVIGLSVLTGLFRGFVKEVFALGVWILAIWLAFHYSSWPDVWLTRYFHEKTVRMIVGFAMIFLGTLLIGGICNAILGFFLKHSGLSGTDRLLGMGFGIIRGIFIVALLMLAFKMTSMPVEQYRRESVLYAQFDPIVDWLYVRKPDLLTRMKAFDKTEDIELALNTEPTVTLNSSVEEIDTFHE